MLEIYHFQKTQAGSWQCKDIFSLERGKNTFVAFQTSFLL